jgi:hypothetical protein
MFKNKSASCIQNIWLNMKKMLNELPRLEVFKNKLLYLVKTEITNAIKMLRFEWKECIKWVNKNESA